MLYQWMKLERQIVAVPSFQRNAAIYLTEPVPWTVSEANLVSVTNLYLESKYSSVFCLFKANQVLTVPQNWWSNEVYLLEA